MSGSDLPRASGRCHHLSIVTRGHTPRQVGGGGPVAVGQLLPTLATRNFPLIKDVVKVGLGRIVALHDCPPTFAPDLPRDSAPLCLNRRCDRTLRQGPVRVRRRGVAGVRRPGEDGVF